MAKSKKAKQEKAQDLPVMSPDKSADPPQPQGKCDCGKKSKK